MSAAASRVAGHVTAAKTADKTVCLRTSVAIVLLTAPLIISDKA
jgi:hypothetical protein